LTSEEDPVMNDIRERITRIETNQNWLIELYRKLDRRVWSILIAVIAGILTQILLRIAF